MTKNDASPKKWTILIYFAGDNNLSEECVYTLKEMKAEGTQDQSGARANALPKVNVVAQFDPVGRGNPTRRFKIRAAGGDGTLRSDVIQELDERDTGYWKNLLYFLCDSLKDPNNKADYYMVILSGHAAGQFEGSFLQDEDRPLSTIPSSFPIWQLKNVFRSPKLKAALGGKRINILGFDACMMSTAEVCYEFWDTKRGNDVVDHVIGSEGFTLNAGWPIQRVVARLRQYPDTPPSRLADLILKDYISFYSDYYLGGLSADLSIINLRRMGDFRKAIDELSDALIEALKAKSERNPGGKRNGYNENGKPFQDALLLAHWASQSYNGEQCVDIYDFCDLLQKRWKQDQSPNSVWYCCQKVKAVITQGADRLIKKSCYTGPAFQYSHGISLYFPWGLADTARSYGKLAFARSSRWRRFIRMYLSATQRPAREAEGLLDFRDAPPYTRGPAGKIHSMRNPPTRFRLDTCAEDLPAPKAKKR